MEFPSLSAGVIGTEMVARRVEVTLTDKQLALLNGTLFSANQSIYCFVKTEVYDEN